MGEDDVGQFIRDVNGTDRCTVGIGEWSCSDGRWGESGKRARFNNIGEMRWSGFRHWDARTGHPSSRGGANEAWAPEKERAQIARQSHAGRGEVRRGRWCG